MYRPYGLCQVRVEGYSRALSYYSLYVIQGATRLMGAKSYGFSIRGGVAYSTVAFSAASLASYGGGVLAGCLDRYLVLVGGGSSLRAVSLRYLFGRISFLLWGVRIPVLRVF